MMIRSCLENMTLPAISRPPFARGMFLNRAAERKAAAGLAKRLNLQPPKIDRAVDHFSGGNQQKVLLAKSLSRPVDVFVFDEPTVGVDVGTRVAIYGFIRDLCEAGAAIVLDLLRPAGDPASRASRLCLPSRPHPGGACESGHHRGECADALLREEGRLMSTSERGDGNPRRGANYWLKCAFVRLGVLPFLVVLALIVFTVMSDNFLTVRNLTNVVRQSVYLTIVSLGQMLALLTGGFDLSVGTILALTSVVGAMAMAATYAAMPEMPLLAIAVGALAGIAAGTAVGICNGIGVSAFGVSPFIMTLGMSSVGFGIALYLTGGVPVYGMPVEFGNIFGFGMLLGIPVPIWVAAVLVLADLSSW